MSNDPQRTGFVAAVAACLTCPDPPEEKIQEMVHQVLTDRLDPSSSDALPLPPSRQKLHDLQVRIDTVLNGRDNIALIYGGATKIKGYVFEAPKLPEIRGASALLDWVNEQALVDLWVSTLAPILGSEQLASDCIIYASGGNILAFAPTRKGQELATAIERCYTEHTLTANSVAVYESFRLLELRYGRLRSKPGKQEIYWVEDFIQDCQDGQKRSVLEQYYYAPPGIKSDDLSPGSLAQRFFNRKTFGELVTVLATMFNRRRDERTYAGEPRSVALYPMLPWAEKCDSSDIRPAVVRVTVGDELAPREMSEPSARKRVIGQSVKQETHKATAWFQTAFKTWNVPQGIASWEQRWESYLQRCTDMPYAQEVQRLSALGTNIKPAQDVGEIAQASSPHRYVGIIYADGNNVGRLIATQKTPEAYHANSLILSQAAQKSVFKALSMHLKPVEVRSDRGSLRWIHPFEILAIGGDDLFLIVPGRQAFDIALAIGYYFEEELAKKLPGMDQALSSQHFVQRYGAETWLQTAPYTPSIGLSAGVLIAQENAPIFFLRDLVEELLKSAKKLAKRNAEQHYYGGAIDFMVLKSITMVTDKIKAFRQAALGDHGDKSTRRLTARPYTWHEFAGLLATVRALKKARVPRSQLYRLRRELDVDPGGGVITSVLEYLYTRSRLRGAPAETLFTHIEQHWCHAPIFAHKRKGLPPWLPLGSHGWETIWPDILEAYEMVSEEDA